MFTIALSHHAGLSPISCRVSCLYIYMCVCVLQRLVLPLENRHEIALYARRLIYIAFERCLESRTSLLSSAMAMGF